MADAPRPPRQPATLAIGSGQRRDGREMVWTRQHVREAGIEAPSSCESGTCGTCETRVLEGVPDHFDAVLSPKDKREGKSMMICCSVSLTPKLVLDL